MHAKSAVAVALLAAAPLVSATGEAIIKNKCAFPVYLWTVSDSASAMQTINSDASYSQGYLTNPNGGGVSMKIASEPDTAGAITQFEYTMDSTLWYDISNINGNPFMKYGLSLVPSLPTCRNVLCPAGVEACSAAYNTPDQNWATAACSVESNSVLILCSGQDNTHHPVAGASNAAGDILAAKNKSSHKHGHHKHKHHHHHHKAAPAPIPVPTNDPVLSAAVAAAAPVTTAVAPVANAGGAQTTFVTQVVTVTAKNKRDAAPSAA